MCIKPGLHLNANKMQMRMRHVKTKWRITKMRQTAFTFVCAANIWRTPEQYPPTVDTSMGIHIQYIYVGSIWCLGECRTVHKCTIHSASTRFCMRQSHSDVNPAWVRFHTVLAHSERALCFMMVERERTRITAARMDFPIFSALCFS